MAAAAARATIAALASTRFLLRAILAFAAALITQQLVLYAAGWPLASHPSAWSLPVLWRIAGTDALAFAVLASVQWIGGIVGVSPPLPRQTAG